MDNVRIQNHPPKWWIEGTYDGSNWVQLTAPVESNLDTGLKLVEAYRTIRWAEKVNEKLAGFEGGHYQIPCPEDVLA